MNDLFLPYDLPYEIIFLTIHYACGHDGCRPVFRYDHHPEEEGRGVIYDADARTVYSPFRCKHCTGLAIRAIERRMEKAGKR